MIYPAIGGFGGTGVKVAVSLGARVVVMGRNEKELGDGSCTGHPQWDNHYDLYHLTFLQNLWKRMKNNVGH